MISRLSLVRQEIFRGIAARELPGYRGIDLLRRELGDTVEFVTVMWFDSLDAGRGFKLLLRFDDRSAHYEVRERRSA